MKLECSRTYLSMSITYPSWYGLGGIDNANGTIRALGHTSEHKDPINEYQHGHDSKMSRSALIKEEHTFIHPAGARKWDVGRHRSKRLLLPIFSIISAVRVCPHTGVTASAAPKMAVDFILVVDGNVLWDQLHSRSHALLYHCQFFCLTLRL